jgi:DNA-binding PadR family transcriptional regulator
LQKAPFWDDTDSYREGKGVIGGKRLGSLFTVCSVPNALHRHPRTHMALQIVRLVLLCSVSATRPRLDYALLGLLNKEPAAGYALRRIFQTTPLGLYSDSPGSIYPALRRLHQRGLVMTTRAHEGRRRRTYRITPRGRRTLRRWLEAPLTYPEIAGGQGGPELRLAFLSDFVPPDRVRVFLRQFAVLLDRLYENLTATRRPIRSQLSTSGAIALDLGIAITKARATWCRRRARQLRRNA